MFRFGDPGGRLYNTAGASNVNMLALWSGANARPTDFSVSASNGRTTGSCLRLTPGGGGLARVMSKALDAQGTWGVAFAFKMNSALPGLTAQLFTWYDTTTLQVDLRVNADGTLSITRNGTVLGTTAIPLVINVWYHIEWKTIIHNTAGSSEVRVNGVSVLNPSPGALNTRNSANATANILYIGQVSTTNITNIMDFDDIIVYDGQANDPQGNPDINDFIGDCGLSWLLPSGAGTTTNFTPDSGSNYARVNEATPDGNTSYVESTTVGHIDTYAMANLPASATTVKSIAVVTYAEKTDVGSRTFCGELRTNSADFAGATSQSLGNSYLYYFNNWGQNPSGTPANWSVSDVNAIESGHKVLT